MTSGFLVLSPAYKDASPVLVGAWAGIVELEEEVHAVPLFPTRGVTLTKGHFLPGFPGEGRCIAPHSCQRNIRLLSIGGVPLKSAKAEPRTHSSTEDLSSRIHRTRRGKH